MNTEDPRSDIIAFQWDFYERAVRNYSVIMRLLDSEGTNDLFENIPRLFVEHTMFNICKVFLRDGRSTRENSFAIDGSVIDLNLEQVEKMNAGALSPGLFKQTSGLAALFVYPLRREMKVFGYLVLGNRQPMDLDPRSIRELEMLCDICSRSLASNGTPPTQNDRERTTMIDETIMNDFPHAFLLLDNHGCVCYANPRAKREFEGTKGLLVGEHVDAVIPGIEKALLSGGKAIEGEMSFRAREALKLYRVECYPVTRLEAGYTGVILTSITERRLRGRQDIQKQKMESIGMLAGGIAHDFNNLLTGILGYASLLQRSLTEDSKLSRYANVIESSAQRAAKLTGHLLNFVRKGRTPLEGVNLNSLLSDVLLLLKESMPDITVKKNLDEGIPPIRGDESELQQVFLNLLVNARDAMQGEGVLTVTTRRRERAGGDFAVIEIRDTGCGIDEEVRRKMFEPFFSTKGEGSGLGIGLYIVQRIVKSHSGTIEVESRKGEGTAFVITLPVGVASGQKQADEEPRRESHLPKKKGVLVVDDEMIVRDLLRGVLAPRGYEVLEAPNGGAALELYEIHKDAVDVIILDMVMPGLKGDAVLSALQGRLGNTKVIISSGFMSEEQRERLKDFKIDAFLDKPYRDKEVLRAMESLFPENEGP